MIPYLFASLGLAATTDIDALKAQYKRPEAIPQPTENAQTDARVALGRMLFFDPRLSGSQFLSCASCHNPALSYTDGLPKARGDGMKELGRRSPTVLNLAWSSSLFWDGRASSLEEQALGPITSPGEMNMPLERLGPTVEAISGYKPLFAAAYPGEGITPQSVAKAIAAYERTLVSKPSRFDAWISGDTRALTPAEIRGFVSFNTKARCSSCHSGWRLTDDGFYDIGLAGDDVGRGGVLPDIPEVKNTFKTPTLRDVDRRYPYMHDGSAATLEEVVSYYNQGGTLHRPSTSPEIKPLGLSATEQAEIVAFLRTLTGSMVDPIVPALPR